MKWNEIEDDRVENKMKNKKRWNETEYHRYKNYLKEFKWHEVKNGNTEVKRKTDVRK